MATPAGWATISITVLGAHKKRGHSATFVCPVSKEEVKLAAILYVDDCDLLHIDMMSNDSTFEMFEKMQESVMNWGRLLILTGGSYKPPTCFYHLISFKRSQDGKWEYGENHDKVKYELRVPMPEGMSPKIEHLPVTTSKETLGVWTSQVGSLDGALMAMRDEAQEWVDKAKEGYIRCRDVWFLLDCQFLPRVGYGLCCNLAEHSKLESCLSKQYYQLMPLGGVIRTAPTPFPQLGKEFFGAGCLHPGIECLIEQIRKLLMHYGCPLSNGMKLKISLRYLVIELGLTNQPFQLAYEMYKEWVTWSWLMSLWEKCGLYRVRVVMNDSAIELPRDRDKRIMWEFLRMGYTMPELIKLNWAQFHQQVLFLLDVVGASGSSLDERYLH